MLLMVVVITVGWTLLIWASSVTMLYFGRFITGMIGGAYCVTVPLYTNEISQKEIRGALGCFTQLMISLGILFATIIGKFLNVRNYTIVCGVLPLIFGCVFAFMPETPTFLLRQNRREAAEDSLKRLRGKHYNLDPELKEIESYLQESEKSNGLISLKESIKKKAIQRACFVGAGLMCFKVFCGIDAITTYLSLTLENAGMDIDVQYGTIIFSFIQAASAVLQIFVVDRLGRRALLLISECTITICLFVVAIIFLLQNQGITGENSFVNYVPLAAFCIFTVGFSMGIGPIPWMMCAEIFPSEIRNYTSSFCAFLIWFLCFVLVKVFMVLATSFGPHSSFFMFAALSTLGTIFVYFYVPETKGLSFSEIQEKLSKM